MHICQHTITLHSDASMFMESSNIKFHWILHNNGRIRTHVQCHPKLYSTFLLSKHFVINKTFSKKLGLQIVPLVNKCTCKIIERDDVILFYDVTSNMSQQCSVGLLLGHWSFSIPSWAKDSVTTRALCGRALSSWKMGCAACCYRKCRYIIGFRISSMKCCPFKVCLTTTRSSL